MHSVDLTITYLEIIRHLIFLSAEEFKKLVSKSEFVISHAGTGTVVSAVKEGKRLLFFQDWQNITSIWIITNWSFVNFLKKANMHW